MRARIFRFFSLSWGHCDACLLSYLMRNCTRKLKIDWFRWNTKKRQQQRKCVHGSYDMYVFGIRRKRAVNRMHADIKTQTNESNNSGQIRCNFVPLLLHNRMCTLRKFIIETSCRCRFTFLNIIMNAVYRNDIFHSPRTPRRELIFFCFVRSSRPVLSVKAISKLETEQG